jgi:hypothetical protein
VNDTELHRFYLDLVGRLRDSGVLCAITSGLACVHYEVAETTKDCDLLCHPRAFGELLELLAATRVAGQPCVYRGNMTPPLAARWHEGGWTSHFQWGAGPEAVTLDVFGRALRGSLPWEREMSGLFASPQIVTEMKRTNRDKDWAFITALGIRMVLTGDPRGWLHLYRVPAIVELGGKHPCPEELQSVRPALRMALSGDPRAEGALNAERKLWEKIDELRIGIYQRAVRPFLVAVRRTQIPTGTPLAEQHARRVELAERHLPVSPLVEYGTERLLVEARDSVLRAAVVPPEAMNWLPDLRPNFAYLSHAA